MSLIIEIASQFEKNQSQFVFQNQQFRLIEFIQLITLFQFANASNFQFKLIQQQQQQQQYRFVNDYQFNQYFDYQNQNQYRQFFD